MTTSPKPSDSAYHGDSNLAELLAAACAGKSVADVRALIAGVLAAPEGYDPESWMAMVVAEPSDLLRSELAALKDTIAATLDDGRNAGPPAPAWRLCALRREMAARGIDGFIVPRADEYQGEYVPACSDRLLWLTGFGGSAGVAVVLADKASIFIDGRYTLQVEDQVRTEDWERRHLFNDPPSGWIAENLGKRKLGYDPWLHTVPGLTKLNAAVEKAGGTLVPCETNPLDAVWSNQPVPPLSAMQVHPLEYAGQAAQDKIDAVTAGLAEEGADAVVISDPASIAWLLNVRGGDIPCTPLSLSFATVESSGAVTLFTDRRKVTAEVHAWLPECVTVQPREALPGTIETISAEGRTIRIDGETGASWFANRIEASGGSVTVAEDPCALPKACKNTTEIAGTRAAHIRDGVALTRFLAWLDHANREGRNEEVDEISAAAKLAEFRAEVDGYRGGSFDTISGFGPNGAVVHYHVSEWTNRSFEPGSLYLVDSGGQYPDGTTDVTRTIAIGEPDDDQRAHFTAVLKGHIAMATARLPKESSGAALDYLARAQVWQLGADFDHGTGHGVGSYLSVHEGPQRVSKTSNVALKPGMIVSNEPGYYRTDAWGIRIENLVVIEEDPGETERPMLQMSTITKAPIDRRLIDTSAMTESEIAWLDAYHADVCDTLTPLLDAKTASWLAAATRPLQDGV